MEERLMDNTSTFRRRIAGLTGEEVSVACEILVNLHPARYLNALAQSLMKQRSEYNEITEIIHKRNEYTKYLVGDRSEYEQEQFVIKNTPKVLPILSENVPSLDDDTQELLSNVMEKQKNRELNVPNFI
jgi:hypothetical protein